MSSQSFLRDSVYKSVEIDRILSLRAFAKQSPVRYEGIASSLALLAMTNEPRLSFHRNRYSAFFAPYGSMRLYLKNG
jgi:hypothetical protein